MKKSKTRSKIKASKLPLPKLQRKLWVLVRMVANKIYPSECYTCGAKGIEGQNKQLGHMIPKSVCGAYLKYDLRNLRFQCASCNIWHGGMGAEFLRNMIIREGQEYVDQIYRDRALKVDPYLHYSMLVEKYKIMLEEL